MKRRNFLQFGAASMALAATPAMALPSRSETKSLRGQGQDILIGQVAPFSGSLRHYGEAMAAGIRAKFAEVNAAGGIRGRHLRLVTGDDQFNPSLTLGAYDAVLQQGVIAFCGNFGTPTTLKALPWLAAHKIPVAGVYSGAQEIRVPVNPYIFNLRGSLIDEAHAIKNMLSPQRLDVLTVIYENDAYGLAGVHAIQSAYGSGVPAFPVDIRAQPGVVEAVVKKALANKPQVVVLVMTTGIGIKTVSALHAAGFTGIRQQIVAMSGVGPEAFAAGLPVAHRSGVLISTITPFPWGGVSTGREVAAAYRESMKSAGASQFIGFASLEGYIDAAVLVKALSAASDLTPGGITDALNGLGHFQVGSDYVMNLSAGNHEATHYANLVYVKPNGEFLDF